MKKIVLSLALCAAITFISVYHAQAGLINYGRRNKAATPATGGYKAQPAKAAVPAQVAPLWMRTAPQVKTDNERTYDVNRDGKLQPAEVKIYLRGIIEIVEKKGGFTVNSDILKEYDKNKDGLISRIEVQDLKRDTEI